MRLLLVEDKAELVAELLPVLRQAGYAVDASGDGEEAHYLGENESYDAVILDLGLPKRIGLEVLGAWRVSRLKMPVLVLTARDTWQDKVEGLKAGADDYLTKPFAERELLARIDALGRRAATIPAEPEIIEADGCSLDLGRLEAVREEEVVNITPGEEGILVLLLRHSARALSRAELL